jgi:hypothetical protein
MTLYEPTDTPRSRSGRIQPPSDEALALGALYVAAELWCRNFKVTTAESVAFEFARIAEEAMTKVAVRYEQ